MEVAGGPTASQNLTPPSSLRRECREQEYRVPKREEKRHSELSGLPVKMEKTRITRIGQKKRQSIIVGAAKRRETFTTNGEKQGEEKIQEGLYEKAHATV